MVGMLGAIGTGATIAITIRAVDRFSGTFKKAKLGLKGLAGIAGKLAVGAFVATGVALGALGVSSIKAAADFEQTQIAFKTMLGSAEEAGKMLKELADFAKKTPFTLKGVERSARQLMAVGFAADDVLPTLKNVGDVAAGLGLGEQGLQRIILNLGQVQAQGKLTGRELRDFAVAGIPMISELAKHFGVAEEAVADMVSKGLVKTEDVLTIFENLSSEGGRFANLMSKQAETVEGKFSNLKDTFELIQRDLGTTLLPLISQLADTFLNDLLPAIEPLIPVIGEFLKEALESIIPHLPEMTEMLIKLVTVSMKLFEAIGPLIPPLIDLSLILVDLGLNVLNYALPAIEKIATAFAFVIDKVTILFGWIKKLIDILAKVTFGYLTEGISAVGNLFGGGKSKKVGDAIIRPNGQIIETSPQDTLIATKTPGAMGGLTVIIEGNNIYGTDPDDIAEALNDKLKTMISI